METKIGTNSRVDWNKVKTKQQHKFCVVIPIYRKLVISERIALEQMHKVFKDKTNVFAFCPEGFDMSEHLAVFPELQYKELDKKWFASTDTYSQLLLQKWFYEMYNIYEYMLICQLDVWLVKDDILEWCNKGYEYIGAPIVVPTARWHNYRIDTDGNAIVKPKIGNGGFSLRKISTFEYLTDPNNDIFKRYKITEETTSKVIYEDLWFCDELDRFYDLERPTYQEGFKFAGDMNPDIVETQYGVTELPTAIHAFDKNIPYWRNRISELSSDKLYDFCYNSHKQFIDIYYYKKEQ